MPIYDYVCESCGHVVEVMHSIAAPGPTTCERCGGAMKRALSVPAIVFKGSGWAKKDARDASRSKTPASTGGDAPSAGDSPSGGDAPTAKEPAAASAASAASGDGGPATTTTGPTTSGGSVAASAGTSGGSGTTG